MCSWKPLYLFFSPPPFLPPFPAFPRCQMLPWKASIDVHALAALVRILLPASSGPIATFPPSPLRPPPSFHRLVPHSTQRSLYFLLPSIVLSLSLRPGPLFSLSSVTPFPVSPLFSPFVPRIFPVPLYALVPGKRMPLTAGVLSGGSDTLAPVDLIPKKKKNMQPSRVKKTDRKRFVVTRRPLDARVAPSFESPW